MVNAGQSEWDRAAYMSIRRRRDALLNPISKTLSRGGIPASAISLFGVVLAAATCWSADKAAPLALLTFLAALACDALDGAVARHKGTASYAGKLVDHACDAATFLLVLLAIARCGLSSTTQISLSALLAVPLLIVAIRARRRRLHVRQEPSGGFLAHVYKAPIYAAFLLHTAGGADLLDAAVILANVTAGLSLLLLVGSMLLNPRHIGPGARAAAEPRS